VRSLHGVTTTVLEPRPPRLTREDIKAEAERMGGLDRDAPLQPREVARSASEFNAMRRRYTKRMSVLRKQYASEWADRRGREAALLADRQAAWKRARAAVKSTRAEARAARIASHERRQVRLRRARTVRQEMSRRRQGLWLLQVDRRRQAWLDDLEADARGWILEHEVDEKITPALFEQERVPWQYRRWFDDLARRRAKLEAQERGSATAAQQGVDDWEADIDGWQSDGAKVGRTLNEAELVELEDDITPQELATGLDRQEIRRQRAVRLRRYATKYLVDDETVLPPDAFGTVPGHVAAELGADLGRSVLYTAGRPQDDDGVQLGPEDQARADAEDAAAAGSDVDDELTRRVDEDWTGLSPEEEYLRALVRTGEDALDRAILLHPASDSVDGISTQVVAMRLLPALLGGPAPSTYANAEARALALLASSVLAQPFAMRMVELAKLYATEVRVPDDAGAGAAVEVVFDAAGSTAVRQALVDEFMPLLADVASDAESAIAIRWWHRTSAALGIRQQTFEEAEGDVAASASAAGSAAGAGGHGAASTTSDDDAGSVWSDDEGESGAAAGRPTSAGAAPTPASLAALGRERNHDHDETLAMVASAFGEEPDSRATVRPGSGERPDAAHARAVRVGIATGVDIAADKPKPWAPGQLEGADSILAAQTDSAIVEEGGERLRAALDQRDPLGRVVTPGPASPPALAGTVDIETGLPWEVDATLVPDEADAILDAMAEASAGRATIPTELFAAAGVAASRRQIEEEIRYFRRSHLSADPVSPALRRRAPEGGIASAPDRERAMAASRLASDRLAEAELADERPWDTLPGRMRPSATGAGLEPGAGTLPLLVDDGLDLAEETAIVDALHSDQLQLLARLLARRRARLEREAPEILSRYDLDAPYRPALEAHPDWTTPRQQRKPKPPSLFSDDSDDGLGDIDFSDEPDEPADAAGVASEADEPAALDDADERR